MNNGQRKQASVLTVWGGVGGGVIMYRTILEKSFSPVLYSGKYNPILTDVLIQQLAVTMTCKNYQLLKLHLV